MLLEPERNYVFGMDAVIMYSSKQLLTLRSICQCTEILRHGRHAAKSVAPQQHCDPPKAANE